MSLINTIGDVLAPLVKIVVKQALKEIVLPKLKEADELAYKTMLISTYAPIDVYVEGLVEKTGTQIDDAIVEAIMEAYEDKAAEDGIVLPNLDED